MTEEQLEKLVDWIDARIDYKIENAFGRDSTHEYIRENDIKQELLDLFKDTK